MSRCPSSLSILLLASTVLLPTKAAAASLCDADDAVRPILDEDQRLEDSCGWTAECVEKRQEQLEEGLRAHPGDVHLHRALQDLFRNPKWRGQEVDTTEIEARYERLLEEQPDDPLFLYLHGRLAEREEARPYFERAQAADPAFPWAYLGLTYVASFEDDVDQDVVKEHVGRFLDLCPASMGEIGSYVRIVEDPGFWRQRLAAFEAALVDAPRAGVGHYRALWQLEFRHEPPGEHAALRQRIRQDLERLETLDRQDEEEWWKVLQAGYELVGDAGGIARAEQALLELDPCDDATLSAFFQRWQEEHSPPDASATDEERSAWQRQQYELTRSWVERCPGHFDSEREHFFSVAELESPPEDELATAGDRFLAAWEESRGRVFMSPSPYYWVSRFYLEHEAFLDRIPAYLEQARADAEAAYERLSEEARSRFSRSHRLEIWNQRILLTEAYLELGRLDDARGELLDLEEDLQEPADDEEERRYRHMAGGYWRLRALLAEAEEQRLDAVVYYRNAHRFSGDDKHLERAGELWRKLGGGDEAWLAWSYDSPDLEEISRWTEKEEPVAELELADLAGKTWRLGDFAGKTVFANIWATWCGPCRKELPFIQELHERLRDDPKTLVVTLNIDDNVGLVAPYMEKNELSFPVLLGATWVRDQLDSVSIPRNWLIDAEGTLRKEQRGFSSNVELEEWIGEVIAELGDLSAE